MKKVLFLMLVSLVLSAYTFATELKPGKNRVSYYSDGEKVAAFLFLPDDYKTGEKRPALVVTPPTTGVKEQTAGLYAEELSKEGFITLTFDPRGFGESEGHPFLVSPFKVSDDTRNSISYLGTLNQVDKNNIFSVGMCAGAGNAAHATAFDARVKALAVISPFLTSSLDYYNALGGSTNLRQKLLTADATVSQKYYETGIDTFIKLVPETEEEIKRATPIAKGMMDYYLPGKPGDVPNWENKLSLMGTAYVLSFSIFDYTDMFDSVPVYVAYGEDAITANGAERFYEEVQGPKDRIVIEDAGHFDLYWRMEDVTPIVDGIAEFFNGYIK